MTIIILISLFLLSVLLHENKPIINAKRQFWFFQSSTLCLLLFVLIGSGFIPHFLIKNLAPLERLESPAWGNKNAIIVLGQGVEKWQGSGKFTTSSLGIPRLVEAHRLYHLCKLQTKFGCTIIVSGGDPLKKGISEAAVMAQDLINTGVAASDIIQESSSNNTFKNAQFTYEIIKREKFDKAILVTSGFHLKRSILYFKHFMNNFDYSAADKIEAKLSFLPRAYNFMVLDLVIHEYLGIMRFHYYNYIGANPRPLR